MVLQEQIKMQQEQTARQVHDAVEVYKQIQKLNCRQKNEMKRQAVAYEQQVEGLKQQLNQVNEREKLRVEAIKARVSNGKKLEW